MNVVYFAWVRERIGLAKETVDTDAATVMGLVEQLRARRKAMHSNPIFKTAANDLGF